jgi:hypothetical protein
VAHGSAKSVRLSYKCCAVGDRGERRGVACAVRVRRLDPTREQLPKRTLRRTNRARPIREIVLTAAARKMYILRTSTTTGRAPPRDATDRPEAKDGTGERDDRRNGT